MGAHLGTIVMCAGKVSHATAGKAHDVCKRTARKADFRKNGNKGTTLHVYRCPHCHRWHVGNG